MSDEMSRPVTITINASSWARVTRERDEAREQNEEQARVFPTNGKNFDYPEGSKTKEQRIAAMIYAENLEQARLLAMSADREEKLRADLSLARSLAESAMLEADRLRAQLHKERA
jgi:hypothetical protein